MDKGNNGRTNEYRRTDAQRKALRMETDYAGQRRAFLVARLRYWAQKNPELTVPQAAELLNLTDNEVSQLARKAQVRLRRVDQCWSF